MRVPGGRRADSRRTTPASAEADGGTRGLPSPPGRRALLYRMVTPVAVYRLHRRHLALVEHRRGFARLRYAGVDDKDVMSCIRRRAWALDVVARCGGARATVSEEQCIARGAAACEYAVTWADRASALRGVVGAVLTALGLAIVGARLAAFGVVPAVGAVAYGVDRWRARRSGRVAQAASAEALRWHLARSWAADAASADSAGPGDDDAVPTLQQEGQLWRISYQGTTVMLRHSRGLALLVHLVRSPGHDIHVRDLDSITPSGGSAVPREAPAPDGPAMLAGDAGEVLDQRAREEYRARIVALRAELDEAEVRHDIGRAEAIREEIDLVAEQLRAAVGRGGRVRRASADVERLRVAITRRLRAAIEQIAKHHPALGAHLAAHVSTGYYCSYAPGRTLKPSPGRA